jgi:hypothetical protein
MDPCSETVVKLTVTINNNVLLSSYDKIIELKLAHGHRKKDHLIDGPSSSGSRQMIQVQKHAW